MGIGAGTEAIQKPVGVCEVRMIENVEKFHAELGRKPFAKLPTLGDRQAVLLVDDWKWYAPPSKLSKLVGGSA